MHKPVRVLVVDDHMLVRAGVTQVLASSPMIEVVGEADTAEEALYLCRKVCPDIVLSDVHMDGMGGQGMTQVITGHYPGIAVIALSVAHDARTVQDMVQAGARGFLPKSVTMDELLETIVRVHAGETVVSHPAAESKPAASPRGRTGSADPARPRGLATQQRRVLALMTKGYTNAEIATYLGISVPTARYHVSAVLAKLGVTNRAEAVAIAVRDALVSGADF